MTYEVDFIASHGHTVFHQLKRGLHQLGNGYSLRRRRYTSSMRFQAWMLRWAGKALRLFLLVNVFFCRL